MRPSQQTPTEHERIFAFLILTYPVNFPIVSIVRPVDIVIGVSFLYLLFTGKLSRPSLFPVSVLTLPLLASTVWGWSLGGFHQVSVAGVGFVVKYLEVLLLVWIASSAEFTSVQIKRLLRASAIVFWIIVGYVLVRLALIIVNPAGVRGIGALRPDFPFSPPIQGVANAGHLMGTYLATGGTFWLAYRLTLRRGYFKTVMSVFLLLGAILLTGSRTPLFALVLCSMLVAVGRFSGQFWFSLSSLRTVVIGLLALALLFAVPTVRSVLDAEAIGDLVRRAVTVDLATDASIAGRFTKGAVGLANLHRSGYILGAGPLEYPRWFDNGLVRILHDFGVIGAVMVGLVIANIGALAIRRRSVYGLAPFAGFLTYAISNIPTEFFLVPRSVVPVVVVMALFLHPESDGFGELRS